MKIRVTSADIDDVIRSLGTSIKGIGKTHEQIAKTACGQLAVELANASKPPFFSEQSSPVAGFRQNVYKEVCMAFPSRSGWYKHLETTRGTPFAKEWWAIVTDSEERGAEFLRNHGIELNRVEINSASHRAVRTGKHGHVAEDGWKGRYIDDSETGRREQFAIRKKTAVGLAKAGWLAAARSASGKSSRVGGKGVGWVREMEGRAIGSGTIQADDLGFTISLTNGMPYADDAMVPGLLAGVKVRTFERIGAYLKTMVRAIAKKSKMNEAA